MTIHPNTMKLAHRILDRNHDAVGRGMSGGELLATIGECHDHIALHGPGPQHPVAVAMRHVRDEIETNLEIIAHTAIGLVLVVVQDLLEMDGRSTEGVNQRTSLTDIGVEMDDVLGGIYCVARVCMDEDDVVGAASIADIACALLSKTHEDRLHATLN